MADPATQESELRLLSPGIGPRASDECPAKNNEGQCPPYLEVDHWPQEARTLKSNATSDKISTTLEIVLSVVPMLFLVLAIMGIRIHGQQISAYGEGIIQATKLGPSIFPIVFTAIVGTMMRNYALWRAENCAPLGILEQLNGSTSFAGTVTVTIALRRFGILPIGLLLLWALSPLGGQSALRMISETPSSVPGILSAAYMSMEGISLLAGTSSMADGLAPTDSIYTASLLASKQAHASPRDLWNWPKIPLLQTLPSNRSGSNAWRGCNQGNTTTYSSLIGLGLQGIPPDSDAEFPVESSYFDLDCQTVALNISEGAAFDKMGGGVLHHNATNLFHTYANIPNAPALAYSNLFIDTTYNFSSPAQSHVNLFYGSRNNIPPPYSRTSLFNCTISTIHVESWISCKNASCAVARMRKLENNTRPESWTPFNDPDPASKNNWVTLNNIITQFPFAAGALDSYQSSPTDSYIYGESSLYSTTFTRDWSTVSEREVSTRFTTLFNTYWQASLAPFTIGRASLFAPVNVTQSSDMSPAFKETTGSTSKPTTVYQISLFWLIMFIVATVILQLCAVAAVFLKVRTLAPDILGYVSSLTRDNPFILLPTGGSSLSGSDRARRLQDLPVQLVDIDGREAVGRIALAAVYGQRMHKLRKRRQYQ
ncbi:hypothetical protein FE257_005331 [Aspergillus nanangensis]|uniref:Uncharacterized protein n=1 Tax=Aspergillus nanangensis TaxID=2582783 RepID=A0AAD4CAA0_ASPNN|nr:hypothetical protein FE257_005331 [Aspergillus nanangensis]